MVAMQRSVTLADARPARPSRRIEIASVNVTPPLLVPVAALSLALYALLAMLISQPLVQAADHAARAWVRMLQQDTLLSAMETVTTLGDYRGLVPLIVLSSLVLWRGNRPWALALPVLMAGTGVLQWITKWAADRPRPDATPWGFPSGHVFSLVVLFALMAYLVQRASHRRGPRLAVLGGAAVVIVVAFSRLYLDKHWLSDLVGGLAIGTTYSLLAIWLVEAVRCGRVAIIRRDVIS
jgi:undecaprenyl-diphosphatase